MYTVRGTIIAKESGKGLRRLVVSAYDLHKPDAPLPELGVGPPGDFWSKLPGQRLGSAVTDEAGNFELMYEMTRSKRSDEARPNLVLIVCAPEDQDERCPRVLHISCVRRGAAPSEHFVIRSSEAGVQGAGVTNDAAVDPPVPRSAVDALIFTLRPIDRARQAERVKGTTFSRHFRARRAAELARLGEATRVRAAARSFRLGLPVRVLGRAGLPEGATVFWDETQKSLMFQTQAAAPAQSLDFKGMRRMPVGPGTTTGLTVDIERREFTLDLPDVPHVLDAAGGSVSQLYRWYSQLLRNAQPPRNP